MESKMWFIYLEGNKQMCGPGSVVGPGIESRWGRDFLRMSRPALRPTQPPVKWVPGISRG